MFGSLFMGCWNYIGSNNTNIQSSKGTEQWCNRECEMYLELRDESNTDLETNTEKDAWCLCMTHCIAHESSYCQVDSTDTN